jgi:hypothetical protein
MLYYLTLSHEQERLQRRLHNGLAPPVDLAPHRRSKTSTYQARDGRGTAKQAGGAEWLTVSAGSIEGVLVAPLPDDDDDDDDDGVERAAQALCDVDGRIKGALTELLNSEDVRADGRARGWVMGRLLEVEREMRRLRGRRRRSCEGRGAPRRGAEGDGREMERGVERRGRRFEGGVVE